MKQKLLNSIKLRALMLVAVMCAAFAGQAWAEEVTASWTATSGGLGSGIGSGTITDTKSNTWNYTRTLSSGSSYTGWSSNCIQLGKNGGVENLTLTTSAYSTKVIKSVSVECSSYQGKHNVAISVGGTTYLASTATASWTTVGTKTGTGTSSGDITISFTGGTRALYIKSISVTYEDAVAPAYSITAVSNNNSYGTVSLSGTTITATPTDGYRVVAGDDGYTVTSGTASVTNNGDNTFSVTPTSNCTVQINFEAIPTYTVSIADPKGGTLVVKNGEVVINNGDEVEEGTVLDIEASPADGYNYTNWQYKLGDGSWNTKTVNYSTPAVTDNISIRANFAAKVYHNAIFQKYDGSEYVTHATKKTEEGQPIDFAGVSNPADLEGRSFVGWVAAKIDSPVDSPEPSFVTSGNMGDADVTYYACYAYCTPGSSATKTDELTTATFGEPDGYTSWSNKQATSGSDAKYAGESSGASSYIQIRATSPSGITSTTTGGKAKKVTVTWNSSTVAGRTLDIYGKNEAYTNAADLYSNDDKTKGTKLGSIIKGTSTEFEITGDYTYIGLRSNSGAMYLDEIDIDWQTGTPDTYSGYCTTVPEDARTAVNIETFTAANTTLVIGDNSTTAVTNDQVDWTPAYIYTSDNTSIATVSDDGVITAVAKGTANITVTLDIPISGGSYKKGTTSSKSIEITVTKPFHTVTFMANGSEVSSASVEEDEDIDVPSAPANVGNFSFQGWKEGSAVDGTQSSAPSYATISTMGDADVTYYAVYAVEKDVTATFDASDITATPATGNSREWEHTATGILLYISAGQHYTSGTPNTFTVSKGASNYFSITTPTGGEIKQIVTTISETDYKIGSVTAGILSTSGTTQTVTFANAVNTVNCKATGSYQIRAKTIVVDATLYENFCTTIPAYSVTVGDAGYTTYVAANNVSFPVGATAYIATAVNPSTIHLEEILAVPTGEAVVVKAAKGTYNLTVESSADCDDVSGNLLQASDGSVTGDGSYIYALGVGKSGVNKGVVGFYLVNSGQTIPAGKAYLNTDGLSVKEFLTFDFDDATAIAKIQDSGSKIQDSEIFNLAGQKMSKLQKGVNIVNGKKVLVK